MSTDGRRYSFPLHKIACVACGLIRTAGDIPQALLDEHYGNGYRLGVLGAAAEPVFFVDGKEIPASLSMHNWIAAAHAECGLKEPASLLEVGCGTGSLLARLRDHWIGVRATGIDPDINAVMSAQSKGIDARVGVIEDFSGIFDLVVSVAVVEHLRSPVNFLRQVKSRLSSCGAAIIVLPVQDGGNRDILFWDHLYHFHTQHIPTLAARAGLRLAFQNATHPLQVGFAMNVFVSDTEPYERAVPEAVKKLSVHGVVKEWIAIVERLNAWLKSVSGKRLTVFGLGETFDLLFTYTNLKSTAIAEGLDDNIDRAKARISSFPVHKPSADMLTTAEVLLVTFDPSQELRESLDRLRIPIFYLNGE